jgi:hypothetical protein
MKTIISFLHKEIVEDIRRSKCLHVNTVKMSILQKLIYGFNVMPIKVPVSHFAETENPIVKLI